MKETGMTVIVQVRVMSEGEWFGGWAPVLAKVEWMRSDKQIGLFSLAEPDLAEKDGYEFYQWGSLVLALMYEDGFKVLCGVGGEMLF